MMMQGFRNCTSTNTYNAPSNHARKAIDMVRRAGVVRLATLKKQVEEQRVKGFTLKKQLDGDEEYFVMEVEYHAGRVAVLTTSTATAERRFKKCDTAWRLIRDELGGTNMNIEDLKDDD